MLCDIVINHRCAQKQDKNGIWNVFGGKMAWDAKAIVVNDRKFKGKGNRATGDEFAAAPNIDHMQDYVRKDLTEWLEWLRDEIGFDGWRYHCFFCCQVTVHLPGIVQGLNPRPLAWPGNAFECQGVRIPWGLLLAQAPNRCR